MAKLAKLMNEISSLKGQLATCNKAYADLLEKYRKVYQKYSYQESMEKVKEINEKRRLEGKIIVNHKTETINVPELLRKKNIKVEKIE